MSKIEVLRTSTCLTCGEEVSYIVTTSSGLWYHTKQYLLKDNHRANPDMSYRQGR